jgi:putative oxidoreductase
MKLGRLIATMITAIRTVHLKNGVWSQNGGYELNLLFMVALLAIVDGGPGAASVDGALGLEDTGSGWALAALAPGAVGSTVAIEVGRRVAPEPSEGPTQPIAVADPEPVAS